MFASDTRRWRFTSGDRHARAVHDACRRSAGRGLGGASHAPPQISAELVRLDPLGLLVSDHHPLARGPVIRVAAMAVEPLLLAEEQRAPSSTSLSWTCVVRLGSFQPSTGARSKRSSHHRPRATRPLRCMYPRLVRPDGCRHRLASTRRADFPISLVMLWRSTDDSDMSGNPCCARRLAATRGWLDTAGESDRSSAATL